MTITLTEEKIKLLKSSGITTLLSAGAKIPKNSIFEPPCSIKWMGIHKSIKMGAFSYGVKGFFFNTEIGRYCSMGEDIQIGRHSHPMHWVSTSPFFYQNYKTIIEQELPDSILLDPSDFEKSSLPVELKKTKIGNDVWIGHGAFILPGIEIGDGAVIAAHAVVTKNVEPYSVVAGSPAKIIKYRFEEKIISELMLSKWWEFAPWDLKGLVVDDPLKFTSDVNALRKNEQPIYQPELILLDKLFT